MLLDEIHSNWAKDAAIDTSEAGLASVDIPKLHHKYLKLLSEERTAFRKLTVKLEELLHLKTEYYLGNLDQQTLAERGWEPFRQRLLKSDVDRHIKADKDVVEMTLRRALVEEKIEVLESILRTIAQRTYHIKNFIEFERFKNGY